MYPYLAQRLADETATTCWATHDSGVSPTYQDRKVGAAPHCGCALAPMAQLRLAGAQRAALATSVSLLNLGCRDATRAQK
jgi:hypothetical protein